MWYGAFDDKKNVYTSSDFRNSTLTSHKAGAGTYNIDFPKNAMRAIIAIPTNLKLVEALDKNDSSSNIISSFQ